MKFPLCVLFEPLPEPGTLEFSPPDHRVCSSTDSWILVGPCLTRNNSPDAQELFIGDLVRAAYAYTVEKKRKTVSLTDIDETIKTIPRFEFLDGPGRFLLPSRVLNLFRWCLY